MPNKRFSPPPFECPHSLSILFLGDVVGPASVAKIKKHLPQMKKEWKLDFIAVNGENADCFGMNANSAQTLLNSEIDVVTGGNHTLKAFSIHKVLNKKPQILRPHNLGSDKTPGNGVITISHPKGDICVINLAGQVYMENADNPFNAVDTLLQQNPARYYLVDFHAEATGEKISLAHHLDGRVSLAVGTHTHVQTADARILPKGTGTITDLGICGSSSSILGMKPEGILHYNIHHLPSKFVPSGKDIHFQGIFACLDPETGNCLKLKRINIDV
ncbi:MAG: TIGR00282 family metallophosphoesterase [Myxococcota bacterium]